MKSTSLVLTFVLAATLAVQAQQTMTPPTTVPRSGAAPLTDANAKPMTAGSGVISGRVVDAATGGVGGARVILTLSGARPIAVLTDGQGRFSFPNLPAG